MSKKLVAEFAATCCLIFAGTGSVIVNHLTGDLGLLGIALSFGFIVTAMIYCFDHISGAHMNPAVTAALWLNRQISFRHAIRYIGIQIMAEVFASSTLAMLFGNTSSLGATHPQNNWTQSFIMEIILSFILMVVIFGAAVYNRADSNFAGLAIGVTVILDILIGGPISGASMNPARSIAPAIVSGELGGLWIYIIAPLLGTSIAASLFRFLQRDVCLQ